ncbi:hypothetical protein EYF80_032130 [Liparis tanakae]|uniref:Uncharacterized protein n=1 Tax=Liparis tanakae TaxID=230148 RepID=A0A4Z2GVR5_9TELE|nr:hypothetical protein EYF80_032130 [Liparis tanakae]
MGSQRFLSRPAHSCTPMMPKMKKTKKQSSSTLPSMGSVSSSRFTRMRMPVCFRSSEYSTILEEPAKERKNTSLYLPADGVSD